MISTRLPVALLLMCSLPTGCAAPPPHPPQQPRVSKNYIINNEIVARILTQAVEAIEANDFDRALQLLENAPPLSELCSYERAKILQAYGIVHANLGQYEKAAEYFEKTLAETEISDLERASIQFSLGQLYASINHHDKAIEHLTTGLENTVSPTTQQYLLLAKAYHEAGDLAGMIATYDHAVTLVPAHITPGKLESYKSLIVFTLKSRDLEKAKHWIRAMARDYPTPPLTPEFLAKLEDADLSSEARHLRKISTPVVSEAVLIHSVSPVFPPIAIRDNIEGYVLLEFTIQPDGSVDKDSIKVIESAPEGIFEQASIEVVSKWKFIPRMVNGEAVAQPNTQRRLTYQVDQ